jgi:tight adherence protein C
MYLLIALLALAAAVFVVGEVVTLPARQRSAAVRRAAGYGRFRLAGHTQPGEGKFGERVVGPLTHKLAGWALKINPRTKVDTIGAKLLAAGLGRTMTPTHFLAAKVGAALVGLFFGLVLGAAFSGGMGAVLFAIMFAAGGFIVPDLVIGSKARRRRESIRAELPDALDLLAVSVEAGLGFDGAVAKLTDHMDGPLIEEFGLALNEMRIGEARQDALKRMAERVPAPELGAFVRAIIQADQLGISLGRILRVQAADARDRRQAAAEEKAMKAPIKMLFPTVIFIFPAMFLVILGPAVLSLLDAFADVG